MSLPIPDYGPYTIDDYDLLPEDDGLRHELINGWIVVSPSASYVHNQVIFFLQTALHQALPDGFAVLSDVDIEMDDEQQCLRPDLVVLPQEIAASWDRTQSDKARLAVEVISPSSAKTDRLVKPQIYARAGIRSYWLVNLDPCTIIEHRAVGARYEEVQRVTGDEIVVTEPFEMTIDVSMARASAEQANLGRGRRQR